MLLPVKVTNKFKKDWKRLKKRNKDMKELTTVIDLLASKKTLPERYRDHLSKGNFINRSECHIAPDWLLIYRIEHSRKMLTLERTGSHADLFK